MDAYEETIRETASKHVPWYVVLADNKWFTRVVVAYELLNRIRLCASEPVLKEAERAVAVILDQYFASNLSLEEMRALLRKGGNADPLRSFAEACRSELKQMWALA